MQPSYHRNAHGPAADQIRDDAGISTGTLPAVEVARTADAAAHHAPAWQALADHASERNPFYEPWCFLPALDAYGAGRDTRLVFVHDIGGATRRLIGVFPLEFRRRYRNLPLPHLTLWQHDQLFLAAPLVDPAQAGRALGLLLDWARTTGAHLLNLPSQPAGGVVSRMLGDAMAGKGSCLRLDRFERALLRPDAPDAEAYIAGASSAGARKNWRRQYRRLSEQGHLELRALSPDEDAAPWIDGFLELENMGWKGQDGTSLAASPADTEFFRRCCAGGHARQALHMTGLFLDGQAVAMQCNLFAGGDGCAFKVAFDERHAALSPGALLEVESIRDVYAREGFASMDSCTGRNHPLMNRIWRDTRSIEHWVAALNWPGQRLLAIYPVLRRLKRRGKSGDTP